MNKASIHRLDKAPKPAVKPAPKPISDATLLDYYATAALRGGFHEYLTASAWDGYDDFAESCFECAAAFVREREKRL